MTADVTGTNTNLGLFKVFASSYCMVVEKKEKVYFHLVWSDAMKMKKNGH